MAIPSLFAWFNIAASWDPFGNMGAMRFAVANDDEGYHVRPDPGPLCRSAPRWLTSCAPTRSWIGRFTTRQDAIEGTKSGGILCRAGDPEGFQRAR